jgi:hypothetical protein
MARDIEEFLRRAAERRQQQQGGGKPAPPPSQKKQAPANPAPIKRAPLSQQQQRPDVDPIPIEEVEIVEAPVRARHEPNLKSSIDTSDISRHADSLGSRIVAAHDRVEDAVHEHLDHNVSKIDDTPTVTDDPSPAIVGKRSTKAVEELRKMLSNRKSVGQAIILAEILKRPDFD